MKHRTLFLLVLMFGTLTACGGGDDGYGGAGDNPPADDDAPTGDGTTPPVEITVGSVLISDPVSNAIVDNQDGTYSQKYSVSVRDQNGKTAPNGVRIDLQVADTILATGTINNANTDTASGTNVVIPSVTDTVGEAISDLTTTYVVRPGVIGGTHRNILVNDLFILTGNVDSRDVVRTIAANPTVSDSLTVSSIFNYSYPKSGNTSYAVAASMLSAGVTGEDADGTPTQGYTVTRGGLGTAIIWITYASNINYIRTGCGPAALDSRVAPLGSSQPFLIATSNNISNVVSFCFNEIGGYQLIATPDKVSEAITHEVSVCVKDGGDGVRVPYKNIKQPVKTEGAAAVVIKLIDTPYLPLMDFTTDPPSETPYEDRDHYTNGAGCFSMNLAVSGAAGTSATVTVYIGENSKIDIPVEIP